MPPAYYPTAIPGPPPPPFPPPPFPQNGHQTWPYHSATAIPRHHSQSYAGNGGYTLPFAPYPPQPQQQFSMGNGARANRAPRCVHQGGMSVYDISGLADWVAANSLSRSEEERLDSRNNRKNKSRDKHVVPSSSKHQDTPDKSRTKRVGTHQDTPDKSRTKRSSTGTTPAHHKHHSSSPPGPTLHRPTPPPPLFTTRTWEKKVVRFTESVQEREERGERGARRG